MPRPPKRHPAPAPQFTKVNLPEVIHQEIPARSKFTEYIGSQFGNPRGFVGSVCCLIMNTINKKMYRKTVELMQQSGIDPADKILDIGYGNGYFLQQADRKCGAEDVYKRQSLVRLMPSAANLEMARYRDLGVCGRDRIRLILLEPG